MATQNAPTAVSTMQVDSQLVRSSEVRCLAQEHLDTQLGGAVNETVDKFMYQMYPLNMFLFTMRSSRINLLLFKSPLLPTP